MKDLIVKYLKKHYLEDNEGEKADRYHDAGAPNDNFRKISVRKTIWDLEFSEHLL